eukprot:TRINITY_DN3645_c0_g1_i5.p1 TRINITY_DN3645_c0_g1~~TRINITY_DN3645_c0_g1_i5.p1  ORF type:complete len:626 (+),score=80.90 TRINITY_DN3645_c0_g1_i5:84-1961(+)
MANSIPGEAVNEEVKLDIVDKKSNKGSGILGIFGWSTKSDVQTKQQISEVGERPKSFNEKQQTKEDESGHKRSRSHGGWYSIGVKKKENNNVAATDSEKGIPASESKVHQSSVRGCFSRPAVDSLDAEVLEEYVVGAPEGMVGIYNLGNTCFINTAVQCLRCTPHLVEVLLPDLSSLEAKHKLNGKSEQGERECTMAAPVVNQVQKLGLQGGSDQQQQQEQGSKEQEEVQQQRNSWIIPSKPEDQKVEAQKYNSQKLTQIARLLLLELLKGEKLSAVKPIELYKKLYYSPLFSDFCDRGQHDCSEFFRLFLQQIHQDLNRVGQQEREVSANDSPHSDKQSDKASCQVHESNKSTNSVNLQEDKNQLDLATEESNSSLEKSCESLPDQQQSIESEVEKASRQLQQFLEREHSPVSDLFMGQIQNITVCNKCNNRSTKYEPFWELNVPLAKESKGGISSWFQSKIPQSIEDTLKAFVSEEVVEGTDAVECEKCNLKTPCTRYSRIHKFPTIIVLTLKRFKWTEGNTYYKIKIPISAPLVGLDLQAYKSDESSKDKNRIYDLYAVCNHSGESNTTGNYTAVCKVSVDKGKEQWVMFNDDKVTVIQRSDVVTPFAYMFFYKSRQPSVCN